MTKVFEIKGEFKMKKIRNIIIALTLVITGITASAQSGHDTGNGYKFYIDDPMNRNTLTFKSEAPLEDIIGTSNQINGFVNFDPENPQNNASADFNVPVLSLNTGIPMRDEHLQGPAWLDAAAYPDLNLKINKVKKATLLKEMDNSKTFELAVIGNFTMHGITKEVSFPARLTFLAENKMTQMRLPGNLLVIRADFAIPLAEYNVTGPKDMKIIGAKISEEIKISVNLMGSTVSQSLAQEN